MFYLFDVNSLKGMFTNWMKKYTFVLTFMVTDQKQLSNTTFCPIKCSLEWRTQ